MNAEHRLAPSAWGETGSIFLATKIAPPRENARWVQRPRLLSRLGIPASARVNLVHAGPGFGKSALLTQWQRELARDGTSVAWLSVDANDDNLHLFIAYLAAAINRVCPEIARDVIDLINRSGQLVSPTVLLVALSNAIADLKSSLVLIVDDFHFIESSDIDDWMIEFISRAPQNLSITIAARSFPPRRLSRLRVNGEVEEIGPADLALTLDEIQLYLRAAIDLKLSPRDIGALYERTEGWPAGLQMVTIALRGKRGVGNLIESFSGAARTVSSYLQQELFDQLPQEIRSFLLRTSILGRLCADVGTAVAGVANAADLIAEIERRELFLLPLDDHGNWYRYHHLFADFLAAQLVQRHPDEILGLHLRASQWFAAKGLWREAVHHAVLTGDYERAAEIADRCAMNLVRDGDYFMLQTLISKLPAALHRKATSLRLAEAWVLALTGQGNAVEKVLRAVSDEQVGNDRDQKVEPEMRAIRLTLAYVQDDSERMGKLLADPDGRATASQPWVEDVFKCGSSVAYLWHRRYADARDFSPCTTVFKRVYQLMLFGWSWWYEGRTAEAEASWQAAVDFADGEAGSRSLAALVARIPLARLDYERGRFDSVECALDGRLGILEQVCTTDLMASATSALAFSRIAQGNRADGIALFDRMRLVAAERGWVRMEALAVVELLRLTWSAHPEQATRLAARLQAIGPATSRKVLSTHWLGARLCALGVAFHRSMISISDDSTRALSDIVDDIVTLAPPIEGVTAYLLLAQALQEHGDEGRALEVIGRALVLGHGLGLGRTFIDAGDWAMSLVAQLWKSEGKRPAGLREEYLDHLLQLAGGDRPAAAVLRPVTEAPVLLEPLSAREREVLLLVGRGLSNREIGRSLRIGPETVKWHLKNTFGKLGVSNRVQALNRARTLALND